MEIGEIAAKNLISLLNNPSFTDTNYTITLQSELIIRASSMKTNTR
jgi:DNA-binding LacI/PurR family transcriptional regulator